MKTTDKIINLVGGLLSRVLPVGGRVVSSYANEVKCDPEKITNIYGIKEQAERQRYNAVRQLFLSHGAEWNEVNLIGIRNESQQQSDRFNDFIGVVIDNRVRLYPATCDPGAYWTRIGGAASDKKGAAHICYGFHKNCYIVGMHYDQEALVQRGAPIAIWRDANHNYMRDANEIVEHGYYGVNIHTTTHNPPVIGRWSAGCQVIQNKNDFLEFMTLIKMSETYRRNGRMAKFSYLLVSLNEAGDLVV